MMTTIDLDLLSTVTGGRQQQAAPQQQPGDQGTAQPGEGGGMPPWVSGIFSFLQSPQFGQIVSSFQDWLGQFMQQGQTQASAQPQQQAQQQDAA